MDGKGGEKQNEAKYQNCHKKFLLETTVYLLELTERPSEAEIRVSNIQIQIHWESIGQA